MLQRGCALLRMPVGLRTLCAVTSANFSRGISQFSGSGVSIRQQSHNIVPFRTNGVWVRYTPSHLCRAFSTTPSSPPASPDSNAQGNNSNSSGDGGSGPDPSQDTLLFRSHKRGRFLMFGTLLGFQLYMSLKYFYVAETTKEQLSEDLQVRTHDSRHATAEPNHAYRGIATVKPDDRLVLSWSHTRVRQSASGLPSLVCGGVVVEERR